MTRFCKFTLLAVWSIYSAGAATAADVQRPARDRFAAEGTKEVPDFQKHVLPMMGKLGCNGRACHGSFQGAGGFRLSLFGYDFKTDHEALLKSKEPRISLEDPEDSKALKKASLRMPHKGGKRMEADSWEYRLLLRWIQEGAKDAAQKSHFQKLLVTPAEIVFTKAGETIQLKVVVQWSDGVREDVTCISRFRTNDDSIASVDLEGRVKSVGKGDTHIVAFYDNGVEPVPVMLPVSEYIGANYPAEPSKSRIDDLVVAKLRKVGLVQSELCTDVEFLRRVCLDLTGTLPTPAEVEAFLKGGSADKRAKKIEELLERPAYAAWWTTKLCDVTGQSLQTLLEQAPKMRSAEFRGWYDWIYRRVKDNVPYDKIVEGIVLANSREPGQSYEAYIKEMADYAQNDSKVDFAKRHTMPYFWARRTVQKPQEKALNFAYTFLGVRLQCAECHKHPFDQWTQQDSQQFTAFFNQIQYGLKPDARKVEKELLEKYGLGDEKSKLKDRNKILQEALAKGDVIPLREVFVNTGGGKAAGKGNQNKNKNAGGRVLTPKVLGGEEVVTSQYIDPRQPLMDWLRSQDNPYFARAFVNRVWANYFNVGIVEPADDMNLANPPSNEQLLDYLAEGFVQHSYDMKWLHREICSSRTYQLSWKSNETNYLDNRNFSRAVIRRLPAEIAYDALVQATGNAQEIVRMQNDSEGRSIGNIVPEGKGKRAQNNFALRVFGKPDRQTPCDCERTNDPTLVQSLFLRNDQEVFGLLNRKEGWLASLAQAVGQPFNASPGPQAEAGKKGNKSAGANRPAAPSLADQIAAAEGKLRRLRATGKNPVVAAQLEQDLAVLYQKQRVQAKHAGAASGVVATADPNKLIREAYLRTVSRPPTPQEVQIARRFINESKNVVTGMRDVLWALINTKEFITNH